MADFDTIAVDLGGVAARFVPEHRLGALANITGFERQSVTDRLFRSGLDARHELGQVAGVDEAVAALRDALDQKIGRDDLVAAWSKAFEPVGDVLSILDERAEQVVLFTNNGPIVEACLDGPLDSIKAVCDSVVCSWRLGAVKPEPEAFARFATLVDSSPQRTLLVDDNTANIAAALEAGWRASLVRNGAELRAVLAQTG